MSNTVEVCCYPPSEWNPSFMERRMIAQRRWRERCAVVADRLHTAHWLEVKVADVVD